MLGTHGIVWDLRWGLVSGHCWNPHISTRAHQLRERIAHSRLVRAQELWRKNKLKLHSISIPISHNPSQTLHEGLVSVEK